MSLKASLSAPGNQVHAPRAVRFSHCVLRTDSAVVCSPKLFRHVQEGNLMPSRLAATGFAARGMGIQLAGQLAGCKKSPRSAASSCFWLSCDEA